MKTGLLFITLLFFTIPFASSSSLLESSSTPASATDDSPETPSERAEFLFKELDVQLSFDRIETLLAHKEEEVVALANQYINQLQMESKQIVAVLPSLYEKSRRDLAALDKTTTQEIEKAQRTYDEALANLVRPGTKKKGNAEKMRTLKKEFEDEKKRILKNQQRQAALAFKESLNSGEQYIKRYQASPDAIKANLKTQLQELLHGCGLDTTANL